MGTAIVDDTLYWFKVMPKNIVSVMTKLSTVDYVVAPYEADAQLAYLERAGLVEAMITEDSDLPCLWLPAQSSPYPEKSMVL